MPDEESRAQQAHAKEPRARDSHPTEPVLQRLAGDLTAGLSVALVLVPQSLAYAELAGVPAHLGLIAGAIPPVAAAFLASSPYLQTGPTAMMSILAFGVLTASFIPGSPEYVAAAALLALLVGLIRIGLGLLRMGTLAYFMSRPVLQGFTSAAALLIILTQIPPALGVRVPIPGIVEGVWWTLTHPWRVEPLAVVLAVVTMALMLGGRRIHPLFPGALVAVGMGVMVGAFVGGVGPMLGRVDSALALPSLTLPWGTLPELLVGAAVIAAVGFAEPAAIARTYARKKQRPWNPDRELISQGAANLAAGAFGSFPVGGSFSRSSLNVLAGARSRWSGLITGLVVLAFMPIAGILAPLPKSVLAGIVIAAVLKLLDLGALVRMWRLAKWQALSAYATFLLTIVLAPRIDYAVLAGIAVAVVLHLWRETQLSVEVEREDDVLTVRLSGVLFFGSTHHLAAVRNRFPPPPSVRRMRIDAHGLGRVDLSGNMALDELIGDAVAAGLDVEIEGLAPYMERVLRRVRRGSRGREEEDPEVRYTEIRDLDPEVPDER